MWTHSWNGSLIDEWDDTRGLWESCLRTHSWNVWRDELLSVTGNKDRWEVSGTYNVILEANGTIGGGMGTRSSLTTGSSVRVKTLEGIISFVVVDVRVARSAEISFVVIFLGEYRRQVATSPSHMKGFENTSGGCRGVLAGVSGVRALLGGIY